MSDNQNDIVQLAFDRKTICEIKAAKHDMTAHHVGDNLTFYVPNKPRPAPMYSHEYLYGD